MGYKIRKTAEQLGNNYYPVGQKGDEYSGNADQDSESSEEINDEMETQEQENYQAGKDNIIINKNDNPGDKFMEIMAELRALAILVKSGYARDLITVTIARLERK